MEAENFSQGEVADHAAAVRAAEGVGCVEHQRQAASFRDPREGSDVASVSPGVNTDDSRGARGY